MGLRLKELLKGICNSINVDIIDMEIMPDHVYLLIDVDPQFGVHRVVKRLKGATSCQLREEFPELKTRLPTLWTNSYFVATIGETPPEAIRQYIESQQTSQRQK